MEIVFIYNDKSQVGAPSIRGSISVNNGTTHTKRHPIF